MIFTAMVSIPLWYIYCGRQLIHLGRIRVSNEPWVARVISHDISGREDSFRHGVRARDGKCVISGAVNKGAVWNIWSGFQACHVFPLEKESLWVESDYGRWITDMDNVVGVSKINSIQNRLLMRADLHIDFDNYLVSINPDVSIFQKKK
jgi:hypothetical protein